MKTFSYTIITVFSIILFSCGGGKKGPSLTGPKIEAYLASYKELCNKAPELLKEANSKSLDTQKQGFGDFESALKNNGLTYPEFVKLNAKIGAVYSILSGEDFMNTMGKMKNEGMDQMDAGMKQMQAQIDDPNTPAEAKEELKKAIEQMKAGKSTINADFEKNKGWADLVMSKAKSVTNLFVSKEDIELVKQYFDKITEAYTGGMVPTNFNVAE